MLNFKRLLLLVLLHALPAAAQFPPYTQVTGTITDPNGYPWSGATLQASLPQGVTYNNIPYPQTAPPVTLSSTGSFSMQLLDVNLVQPPGLQWTFQVCIVPRIPEPLGRTNQCLSVSIPITGASMDLTSQLSAAAPALINQPTVVARVNSILFVNGINYTTLQAAHDALPGTGGIIWDTRQGNITWTSLTISKNLELHLACGAEYTWAGTGSPITDNTPNIGISILGCGGDGGPLDAVYGWNTGAATLFTVTPTGANTDVINISTTGTLFYLRLWDFRINASANVRDHVRFAGNPRWVDVERMTFGSTAGGVRWTGHAVNFNGTGAIDFFGFRKNFVVWGTHGVRFGNYNTTGSLIEQNQFTSLAGRAVYADTGGMGQISIRNNAFTFCNQVTAGGAVHLKPDAGAVLNDVVLENNSYQANGTAGAGTSDVLIDGSNAGSSVHNIHVIGEQFNDGDGVGIAGAKAAITARSASYLFIEGPHLSASAGNTSGFDIDSSNSFVFYMPGKIDSPAVEFIDDAGLNCTSSASPAACAGTLQGSVTIAAAATAVTVNTTGVTANSQIFVFEDSSLGAKLSVTCNTTTGRTYTVTARTAGTSFVITASAAPVADPACLSYSIVN